MNMRSHLSTFFNFSGATGLFMTQGSMMISFHLALRTFQVPWPTHVKLTSAFSGIRFLPHSEREVDETSKRKRRFSHSANTKTPIAATVHRFGKIRSQGWR